MNRHLNIFLKLFNKRISIIGKKKVCHILDTNSISAHLFELLSKVNKVFFVMNGAFGVAQSSFTYTTVFFTALDSLFNIANIIKSIKYSDNLNTVLNRFFNKHINNIVRIMLVTEKILSTKEHLQLSVRHMLLYGAESFPGVFVKETHTRVKGSTAPTLNRPIAHRIQFLKGGNHILKLHSGCSLRLMSVTKNGIGYI